MKRVFRFPWRTKSAIKSDVDAELLFHIDARTDELVSHGSEPKAARAQALREFGDVDDARRYITNLDRGTESHARRKDYLGELRQDLTYALRKLKSSPAFVSPNARHLLTNFFKGYEITSSSSGFRVSNFNALLP